VFHNFQGNALFQKVFIMSCCHFSNILPTWFLVFITTKYPMVKVKMIDFMSNFSFHFSWNKVGLHVNSEKTK